VLAVYQPDAGLERGRCVGNGAIPVLVADEPYARADRLVDPPMPLGGITPGREGAIYAHGSALLDLGQGARVGFYQATRSTPLYSEWLDEDAMA